MNINVAKRIWTVSVALLFGVSFARSADPLDHWASRWVDFTVLRSVAYGAGVFVAVSDAGYSSPDSVCWVKRPLDVPARNGLRSVAYGNGRFVALEPSSFSRPSSAYVSTDGLSWRRSADLPQAEQPILQRVFFAGGRFLAVYNETNPAPDSGAHLLLMSSPDGAAWSRHIGPTNTGASFSLNSAIFGDGIYVVAGWAGLLASTDLSTWTQASAFPLNSIEGVVYGKGRFVAVGLHSLGPGQFEPAVATSTNGVDWTSRSLGLPGRLLAVAFGGDHFVAVGESGLLLSSTNGLDWTQHTASVDVLTGVTYGSDSFVAVGGFYTALPRSVAFQSGGRPQLCLEARGFGTTWNGFRLFMTAGPDRTYRIQSTPDLSAASWTDVTTRTIGSGPFVEPFPISDLTAPSDGQRYYRAVSP